MRALELLLGAFLVLVVLSDVFQAVVVPRPTRGGQRIARGVVALTWRLVRALARASEPSPRRERVLGYYAPLVVVLILVVWVAGLTFGYGLVFHALREQIRPVPADLGTAIYFAATSLLTIGFGDVVATDGAARSVAIVAAGTGLAVVALTITFLFSLYASFQRREVLVATLDARGGAPPSGVTLLETALRLDLLDDLGRTFGAWEGWSAEVLETHVAYPVLAFFRSTHDNESWVGAIGAVLDASTLLLTTVEGGPKGAAHILHDIGVHLVEDLTSYFGIGHEADTGVERAEFDAARERLAAAGYRLGDAEESWRAFSALRARYAGGLIAMARFWAVPPAQWIGDRTALRHPSG